ncbi:MAG: 50S ribosomal protein L10 [Methylococcales bacterium]|jgi:large subunit ribosomal protein L10|nr:50S ribosomal protein L10 [Methylococcales bacterium]MBT7442482.1 50S ribosomal protein L10 [Methylococcales bacterium]
MALNLEQKKAIVAEVAEVASTALSVVAAEYKQVTATDLTQLRAEARSQGVHLQVVKNSLAKRAMVGTEFECMADHLTGPLILAFSQADPGCAARVIKSFVKENKAMEVKVVSIGGKVMGASDLDRLASLPTYDQSISILMSVMKAPIEKFVRTLNEPTAKMVRTLAAVKESKA